MGSRMLLLLLLVLLIFTDHSRGVQETHKQSSIVNRSTDGSAVGEPLITANPINIPRQHNKQCNCKGKEKQLVNARCPCKQSGRRKGKSGKWKKLCQTKKKCIWKQTKVRITKNFGPSVPI